MVFNRSVMLIYDRRRRESGHSNPDVTEPRILFIATITQKVRT